MAVANKNTTGNGHTYNKAQGLNTFLISVEKPVRQVIELPVNCEDTKDNVQYQLVYQIIASVVGGNVRILKNADAPGCLILYVTNSQAHDIRELINMHLPVFAKQAELVTKHYNNDVMAQVFPLSQFLWEILVSYCHKKQLYPKE